MVDGLRRYLDDSWTCVQLNVLRFPLTGKNLFIAVERYVGIIANGDLPPTCHIESSVDQGSLQAAHILRTGESADNAQVVFDRREVEHALSDKFICCSL